MKRVRFLTPILFVFFASCVPVNQTYPAHAEGIHKIAFVNPQFMDEGIFASFYTPAGLLGALAQNANKDEHKEISPFTIEVEKKFPKTIVYQDFCDEVVQGIKNKGFGILDVSGRPNEMTVKDKSGWEYHYPRISSDEADVILVPRIRMGYFASSGLDKYRRSIGGTFALIDTKTNTVSFYEGVQFHATSNDYEYASYNALTKDLDNAVRGLQDAGKSVADQVVNAIQ